MAVTTATRLAIFSDSSRPHHGNFLALLPPDVQLEFLGYVESEAATGSGPTVEAARAAAEKGLQGVLVTGAPREVANPTLFEDLRSAVDIPVTTALNAGAAALHAYGARRALVLTPFDEQIRNGIRDNLAKRGIEATVPYVVGGGPAEATGLGPETVYELAHSAWEVNRDLDTIYFQGAVLDPLPVIERLEKEIGKPIVASNPAMLWYILSKLGRTYHIEGHGRLLSEWPALPA
jgi:maleate cis-trans isomerase